MEGPVIRVIRVLRAEDLHIAAETENRKQPEDRPPDEVAISMFQSRARLHDYRVKAAALGFFP